MSQQYERHKQTSLCDRGRVYGSCPTTTARFLRVAVTYTRTHWGRGEGESGLRGGSVMASDAEWLKCENQGRLEITVVYSV